MASKKKQLRRDLVLMRTERDQALERLEDCQGEAQVTEGLLDAARQDLANEQAARRRDASTWEDQRSEGLRVNQRLTEHRDQLQGDLRRARDAATMEANTLRDTIEVLNANLETATAAEAEAVRESQARGARITELEGQNRTITQQMVTVGDERNRFADESRRRGACLYELASQLGVDMPPHEPGETIPVNMPLLRERITDLHARATRAETVLDASSTVSSELARYEAENALLRSDIHAIAEALGMADDPYEPGGAERLDNLELLDRIKELRSGLTPFINTAEHAAALGEIRSLRTALEGETQRRRAAEAEKDREVEKKDAARREADELLSQADVLRSEVAELTEALATCEPGVMRTAPSHVVRMATRQEPDDANQAVIWEPADPFASLTRSIYDPNTLGALSLHARVLASMGFHVRCTVTRAADVTVDAPEAHTVFRDASEDVDHAAQVARLAKFILEHVPGEPSRSEGAVDTAIRLLKGYALALEDAGAPPADEVVTTKPEVVLLGITQRSHVDLLSPALRALSRELGEPVHVTAMAPGNVIRLARTPIETVDGSTAPRGPSTPIAMPGEVAPTGFVQELAKGAPPAPSTVMRPPRFPVDTGILLADDGHMTNHGTEVPAYAIDAQMDAREAITGEHACKAQPEDWKRCRGNPEAHDPHDWWDDHEPDATRWHCAGAPLADGPAGPIPCAAEPHFAPPSAEQLADEGYIGATTYDEPSDPQRAKVAELAELLGEVDEELDERGASRLAEPLAVATADELATLQRTQEARIVPTPTDELSEAVLERYTPADESQHDPARTTDATELTEAIEQLAEDEGIVDTYAPGALTRDWLEGQRETIAKTIDRWTEGIHGVQAERIADDIIDTLAGDPPPATPET